MSDAERTATASVNASDDVAQRLPRVHDLPAAELPGEEYSTGLPGLRLIRPALRRSVWLWVITAAIGLVIGAGLYVKHTSYQASTTVVLVPNPVEMPTDAILTDIALAQSQTVAGLALRELGLRQSAGSFVGSYKVVPLTDRVIQITLTAPSSSQAVARAQAVANAFLQVPGPAGAGPAAAHALLTAAAGHPGQAADQGDGQPDRPAFGPALLASTAGEAEQPACPAQPGREPVARAAAGGHQPTR